MEKQTKIEQNWNFYAIKYFKKMNYFFYVGISKRNFNTLYNFQNI